MSICNLEGFLSNQKGGKSQFQYFSGRGFVIVRGHFPFLSRHHVCLLHLKGAHTLVVESSPSLSECLDDCSVDKVVTRTVIVTIAAVDYARNLEILRKLITGSKKKKSYKSLIHFEILLRHLSVTPGEFYTWKQKICLQVFKEIP